VVFDESKEVFEHLRGKLPLLGNLDSFPDAIVVAYINGKIVAANSQAEKLFGWGKGELACQFLTVLMPEPFKSLHDSYLFRHEKYGQQNLIGKDRFLKGETREGDSFDLWISLTNLPLKGYFMAVMRSA